MVKAELAVVGGGAGAIALAHHLAKVGGPLPTLVEARSWGGPAYATSSPSHLLNVPAGRMGLNPENPGDFLAWLQKDEPEWGEHDFVPRCRYGDYLTSVLAGLKEMGRVQTVSGEVVGLDRSQGSWVLQLLDGRRIQAEQVVLALGPFPPSHPPYLENTVSQEKPGRYVADPWRCGPLPSLASDASVAVVGTGLTAIDVALSLADSGHQGQMYLLGRRALLPQRHAMASCSTHPPALALGDRLPLSEMVARLRAASNEREGGWRSVVDGLRSLSSGLWAQWSAAERKRFLRHARPYWEAHRHRMAPEVADRVAQELNCGRWRVVSGRLQGIEPVDTKPEGPLRVRFALRAGGGALDIQVARVYNATGPEADARRLEMPLVRDLLAKGWALPDPLALGLATGPEGQLLCAHAVGGEGLWTLGALRKGALWESTAMPELRAQAAALARRLRG